MPAFKEPSFQERAAAAARAKSEALAKLRAKPPLDDAIIAQRAARTEAREAAEADKRQLKLKAAEEAAAIKQGEALKAAQAAEAAARQGVLSAAEQKAARDARYAARKNRR